MEKKSKNKNKNKYVKHKEQRKKVHAPRVKKADVLKAKIADLKSRYESIDVNQIKTFSDFPLSEETLKGLKDMNYDVPTKIQKESLGLALQGLDILGAAKTGSGKTLAFIIPIIERLFVNKWTSEDGVGALIVTPTRELAYQIFECLKLVGAYHDYSAGLVIGGKDLKYEWQRVVGCNIIVCTPGRILHHLDENSTFNLDSLQILVLDEADRCLDMGFKVAINALIEALPSDRQTLLFSATQTRSVSDLARLSLDKPVYVSVHENSTNSTPNNLKQSYVVLELHEKVNMIWSFLKCHRNKKTLVFLQSCKQVKYMKELFSRMRLGVTTMALYGTLHQLKRMQIYDDFVERESSVMFATDIAARGLDFPAVDWVIQMDCPEDGNTYIHRAGRTARYNTSGESLLLLLPSEEKGMMKILAAHKIPIERIEINASKVSQTTTTAIASCLAEDVTLKESAQRAFQAYVKSIYLMKNKSVFNVEKLDLPKFSVSLGLIMTPRVRFLDKQKKIKDQQTMAKKKNLGSSGETDKEMDEDNVNQEAEEQEHSKDKESVLSHIKFDLESDNENEEDDDVMTVKRRHVFGKEDPSEGDELLGPTSKKSSRTITKVGAIKKMLKKNILPNTKITFGDEGEILNSLKESAEGVEYENDKEEGGIDIEKARQVLKAEDKFDKEKQKQRKKEIKKKEAEKRKKGKGEAEEEGDKKRRKGEEESKEEEESDSDESVDLSWLQDPNKYYGKKNENSDDESDNSDNESSHGKNMNQESDDESESSSDENVNQTIVKEKGKSKTIIKKHIPRLRREDQHEGVNLDTGLDLEDDEDLALQLLLK